mmetsp:Transcript_6545/g.16594  ORF Transcript_6545/g.16594 Transcript_6545/m.16594 type:complete len:218 (+) Transcript_6545:1242-1895(+)
MKRLDGYREDQLDTATFDHELHHATDISVECSLQLHKRRAVNELATPFVGSRACSVSPYGEKDIAHVEQVGCRAVREDLVHDEQATLLRVVVHARGAARSVDSVLVPVFLLPVVLELALVLFLETLFAVVQCVHLRLELFQLLFHAVPFFVPHLSDVYLFGLLRTLAVLGRVLLRIPLLVHFGCLRRLRGQWRVSPQALPPKPSHTPLRLRPQSQLL